ncbi:hypothetical protein [Bacillus swezeyi]|uniref:GRAM domain-containing protein n=1 Tax=Bacillus swezeyi TaxID=1925020 RepID=A0A5M8RVR1_9BACI|nr:hypothetical protein [Bacillus swezeyi]KAA6452735.1 hypothetical protein DX927_00470 [Bacillus swezeyi]KAA6472291.1 hypothetical protein DX928_23000 [Bacillus swezeyi]TYS38101.1 hypothetical protein FZC77_00405 [Bacillus swezeyi]
MSLKEIAIKEFNSKMVENEEIQGLAMAYYEFQSGISGIVGTPNGTTTPIKGFLAYSNKQLLFYGEVFKAPTTLQISYSQIIEVKEKKQGFALFKSFPSIIVYHNDKQEIFTTRGDKEEFAKLREFFEKINRDFIQTT